LVERTEENVKPEGKVQASCFSLVNDWEGEGWEEYEVVAGEDNEVLG
jgi:hypothetical protein